MARISVYLLRKGLSGERNQIRCIPRNVVRPLAHSESDHCRHASRCLLMLGKRIAGITRANIDMHLGAEQLAPSVLCVVDADVIFREAKKRFSILEGHYSFPSTVVRMTCMSSAMLE